MAKKGRRRGKIRIRKSVQLKHKTDATRVSKPDTIGLRKAPTRLAPDVGANFRIKIRRK